MATPLSGWSGGIRDRRQKAVLAPASPLPGVGISLPLIAALRAAKAPVVGHRLFAVVAQAIRLQALVWLPGGAQAGLTFLFFSDGGLVGNVGHEKNQPEGW